MYAARTNSFICSLEKLISNVLGASNVCNYIVTKSRGLVVLTSSVIWSVRYKAPTNSPYSESLMPSSNKTFLCSSFSFNISLRFNSSSCFLLSSHNFPVSLILPKESIPELSYFFVSLLLHDLLQYHLLFH